MTIHQLLPAFFAGDAIGNQASEIRAMLRAMGMASSQIFAQYRDAREPDGGRDFRSLRLGPHDWLMYHHSIGSPVVPMALRHLDRLIFYYHNVTPGDYLRDYDRRLASLLDEGRQVLPAFHAVPLVFTDSPYNAEELRSVGFREAMTIPLLVDTPALLASAQNEKGQAVQRRMRGGESEDVNWLFVGRLAPNKRQDTLIRAFHYYHRLVKPRARLFLVGSNTFAPGYRLELEGLVAALGLREQVVFVGSPSMADGFGGYYAGASVFVCASEHEGFCVPIVEAMAFGLPVVAYACTGVPYAMGRAGLLVGDNAPATLAEGVNLLLSDRALRRRLSENQPAQVARHAREQAQRTLVASLQTLSEFAGVTQA